jgi:hypothetical protein
MKKSRKQGGTIDLGARRIPTQKVSTRTPLDASRYIPIVGAGRSSNGVIEAIRRADLLPKSLPATAIGKVERFGDLLVDVFSPVYGSDYPLGKPAFLFDRPPRFPSTPTSGSWGLPP